MKMFLDVSEEQEEGTGEGWQRNVALVWCLGSSGAKIDCCDSRCSGVGV